MVLPLLSGHIKIVLRSVVSKPHIESIRPYVLKVFRMLVYFDETKLSLKDVRFLEDWADSLGVTLEVLLSRILAAAAIGEHYLTGNPAQRESAV